MIFSANYWEFEQGRGFMVLEPTREADNAIPNRHSPEGPAKSILS